MLSGIRTTLRLSGVRLLHVSPETTRVGWIGPGVMGKEMCKHIMSAGYPLSFYARSPAKASDLVELGATAAESPQALAENCDVVFSMVGFPSDVRQVLLSSEGVLPVLAKRPNTVIVDMTTSEPSLAKEIAKEANAKGVAALDCPVTGGDVGAKNGTLSIMVGGDSAVVNEMKPLLSTMGTVFYLGEAGAGQSCKAANQITIATSMLGMCEGLLYAHKAGLNLEAYIAAIRNGGAGSKSIDLYAERILNGDYEPGFFIKHFVKDLGIALQECQAMKLSLPGLALAQQLYISLEACGYEDNGTQALVIALERLNNVKI